MDRRELFKVINGGLPSEKQMRRETPTQFKELLEKLKKIEKYQWQPLNEIRSNVNHYKAEYGNRLEFIYQMPDKELKNLHYKLNKAWLPTVNTAIKMQAYEKRTEREKRNIGKEPGE